MAGDGWTIDVYETEMGEKLVWAFVSSLTGRDKVEAIALIGLLGQQGNQLRRPQSGMLGDGLFELRGKQIRIFYMFLPERVIVLLDGEIKKQNKVPPKTIERMRRYMKETLSRHKKVRRVER